MSEGEELRIGDRVLVRDNCEGKIFGIAGEKDIYDNKYAVSLKTSDGLYNEMYKKSMLEKLPRNKFKVGAILVAEEIGMGGFVVQKFIKEKDQYKLTNYAGGNSYVIGVSRTEVEDKCEQVGQVFDFWE